MHLMRNAVPRGRRQQQGFSLIEVLVTMLILTIGFLGLAKMQAAAISNTQVARVRSVVALQAASLVGSMHSNPEYWRASPASFSASGTSVSSLDNALSGGTATNCMSAGCTPAQLAGADVARWVSGLNMAFPGYNANVACTAAVTSGTLAPARCNITVQWTEKYVAGNRAADITNTMSQPKFTLLVEP